MNPKDLCAALAEATSLSVCDGYAITLHFANRRASSQFYELLIDLWGERVPPGVAGWPPGTAGWPPAPRDEGEPPETAYEPQPR